MNVPPKEFVRVSPDRLRSFTVELFRKAGMPDADARLLADLLVASDLRGVRSHGTWQAPGYLSYFREGKLNVRPQVRIVQDTEATAVLDGDGGLGYFPAFRAAQMAVQRAKRLGVAVGLTRNHGHIGAAGHYARIASAADCIGMCISSARYSPSPEYCVWQAAGCPPICIAIPHGNAPPIAPDMGLYIYTREQQTFEDLFSKMPDAFFKILGLAAACRALGGMLAGIHAEPAPGAFEGANQGSFILAVDVAKFIPLDEFKRHVDAYVTAAQNMKPFPGCDRAELPGGLEWRLERDYARDGIPIGRQHQAGLDAAAAQLGVAKLTPDK
ncbi:MAG: Ldh family oxidoreductase [Planctomycetes bacterium]|nr:Ldh family oxidoreductase [Planctomycetota bacterium]